MRSQERPGPGLALTCCGLLLGFLSFVVLPWVDAGAGVDDPTFMDLRDAISDMPEPTESVADVGVWYAGWAAFTAFGVVALLALMAGFGLRSGATTVVRTLGVVAAIGGIGVHWLGVWQLFSYEDNVELALGSWVTYGAYGLLLLGSALGPQKTTTTRWPTG